MELILLKKMVEIQSDIQINMFTMISSRLIKKTHFSTEESLNSAKCVNFPDEKVSTDNILDQFWNEFYDKLNNKKQSVKSTNISIYQKEIFDMLKKKKTKMLNDEELKALQYEIEFHTISFDENIIFKHYPKMINLLIGDNKITAKEYLKSKNVDLKILDHFGCYTLEALIIHVLGLVFTCSNRTSLVKVSSLIDQLDSAVNDQVRFITYNNLENFIKNKKELEISKKKIIKSIKKKKELFKIGTNLVEFMIDREVIILSTEINISDKTIVKDIGKGYKLLHCYVFCNFSLTELPIKLHLPMVYKPNNWVAKVKNPNTLSDISGGYFCNSTIPIINRFSVITSRDVNNFNIQLTKTNYISMFNILNNLQLESFSINKDVLEFIILNRKRLEELELLMPRILAYTNIKEAYDLLRFCFFSNSKVKNTYSINYLIKELSSRIQKSYYEETVLSLAEAYNGFDFYLPAFMDFRGRIYRTGILHYHERDLARSLIVFSNRDIDRKKIINSSNLYNVLACAAAFKFKKFNNFDNSLEWFKDNYPHFESCDRLMNLALGASEPFQFISMIKSILKKNVDYHMIPVTQDASASAYQIMSYLLLNKNMGRITNLLPSGDGLIQDVYMSLMDEFKSFLSRKLSSNKYIIIESMLTRKLIKKLFMPIIYGKKVNSMANDIKLHYGSLLSIKDTYIVAEFCNEFWKVKYPDIFNLMNLINLIGWFCSKLDRAVIYSIPYFSTVQDYMCSEKTYIWVYDNISKKKRKISFIVPTTKRDSRKTQNATCANFIHQKDAYIAMKVVDKLLLKKKGPVYTVHDNFITTSPFVKLVPNIYIDVFKEMGPPLLIINKYVVLNLVYPYINTDWFITQFSNFNIIFDTPLSRDFLKEFLDSIYNYEKNINNNKVSTKTWLKKTSEFVNCYNNYINTVCYNNVDSNNITHYNKWFDFETELNKWKNEKYNYSVHI